MYEDAAFVVQAFDAGAMAYVTKSDDSEALLAAIDAVGRGAIYFGPNVAEKIALSRLHAEPDPVRTLSPGKRISLPVSGGAEFQRNRQPAEHQLQDGRQCEYAHKGEDRRHDHGSPGQSRRRVDSGKERSRFLARRPAHNPKPQSRFVIVYAGFFGSAISASSIWRARCAAGRAIRRPTYRS
jgi:hypothetical protein